MLPTFRWLERGEGEPIVLLHGLMGRMDHWDSALQALARIGRPIAPDVPILDPALAEPSVGAPISPSRPSRFDRRAERAT